MLGNSVSKRDFYVWFTKELFVYMCIDTYIPYKLYIYTDDTFLLLYIYDLKVFVQTYISDFSQLNHKKLILIRWFFQ